jgi:outer membrane protein TolC
MLRRSIVGVWALALLLARPAAAADASAASPPAVGLRIEDAVQLAVTRNERARISDLGVVVAEAGIERARAGFLPVLTAVGSEQQHLYAASDRNPNNIGSASLTINQPIINASAYPLYRQAKNLANAQRAQNVDDKRLLAFSTASAFFAVLNAQDVMQAAQQQLDTAKANMADTQARAEAGLNSSNDVTRALVDMGTSGREAETDRGTLDSALVELAFVVNAPVPASLAPPVVMLSAAEQSTGPVDALVRFAMNHRPDVLVSKYVSMAAHDFANEPLLRTVPTLGLQGQASATNNSGVSGRWNDEQVQATLSWTLYDAGVRYADKHARDAQAQIADLTRQQLGRSVDAQVRSGVALLMAAQRALHVADDSVKAAQQSVEETAILYRQGLAKAIELVDANDKRFAAEIGHAAAEFAVAQTYLNLRQALGLGPLGTEE